MLGPVALLCIYGIAKRIGGQLFAYWAVLLWLTVPFIGIKFTDYLYHQRYTEVTLPQGFGLTAMADFPSMVFVLVSVYFGLRVIERTDRVEAIAAGLAAGDRSHDQAVELALPRRPRLGLRLPPPPRRRRVLVAGMVPALASLALWKYRGLGYLPLFHDRRDKARARRGDTAGRANPLHQYVKFDWHRLNENLIGDQGAFLEPARRRMARHRRPDRLARRSLTATFVVGGWFAAFVITKATYPRRALPTPAPSA